MIFNPRVAALITKNKFIYEIMIMLLPREMTLSTSRWPV